MVEEPPTEEDLQLVSAQQQYNAQDDEETNKEQDQNPIDVAEIEQSQGFSDFVQRTSLFIERILQQPYDPFINYLETELNERYEEYNEKNNNFFSKEKSDDVLFRPIHSVFIDDKWSKGRAITSLCWSKDFPDLFLASYHSRAIDFSSMSKKKYINLV